MSSSFEHIQYNVSIHNFQVPPSSYFYSQPGPYNQLGPYNQPEPHNQWRMEVI